MTEKKANVTLNTSVKEWYMFNFFWDELGGNLKDDVTFNDVFCALDAGEDFYSLLGGDVDSVIRERIFEKLADLLKVDYNQIYHLWMNGCAKDIGLDAVLSGAAKRSEATIDNKGKASSFDKECLQ